MPSTVQETPSADNTMVFVVGCGSLVPAGPIPSDGDTVQFIQHGCATVEEEATLVRPFNLALTPLVRPYQPIRHSKQTYIFGQLQA